ncbi:MAG: polysaccharide pyruvyl transferase CsaB [Cellulosilyticaceae bacterium]
MDNKTKVVISGYYGFNNIGDEAILYTMIEMLKKNIPNISITVLSNNPEETEKTYQVEAINRWDIRSIVKHIKGCDMVVSGGGSLLQDVTSWKTIPYYLGIIKLGLIYRKKVVFYSQGIGPVNKWWNKWLIKKVASQADHIFVRESMSEKLLKEIGVTAPTSVAIDPVFGIHLDNQLADEMPQLVEHTKKIGVYLRPWKNDKAMVENVCRTLKTLINEGYEIYMMSMHYEQDIAIARQIADKLKSDRVVVVDQSLSIDETLAYTAQFDFIIGMRLHSLIMAVAVGTPTIALSYDPKVENVMGEMNINHYIKVEELTDSNLLEEIRWVEAHLIEEKQAMQQTYEQKIEQIYSPIFYIKECLERSH